MSWFPHPSSPRAALRDLIAVVRHSGREQRIGAALALLVTAIIVIEFLVDAKIGTAPVEREYSFDIVPTNRSDAEILADLKKDQAARDAAKKEEQRQYQKLEKQLGIE